MLWLVLVLTVMAAGVNGQEEAAECGVEDSTFELVTGYVLTAPGEIIDTLADTLQLADCIEMCRQNDTCQALNFETGLCVLFSTSALASPEALTISQFPVYTIYAHKVCLVGSSELCGQRSWAYEMVPDYQMTAYVRKRVPAANRVKCMELCLNETEFQCR